MCYSMNKRDIAIFERRQRLLQCPNQTQRDIIIDKYQATEKRLEEILSTLSKPHCPIHKLEIRQNQMNERKIQILCEAIRLNTSLNKICFTKCRIRSSQLGQLCAAICKQKSQCIQELHFYQVRINTKGAEQISKILTANIGLNRLHLVDCGIDDDILAEICKGLQDSMSIQYLDLRNNTFDSAGLQYLIKALEENMSLKQLFLESVKIDKQEAKILANFLGQKDCQIQELQLSEADLDKDSIDMILEALFSTNHLKGLSLSKNTFNEQICQSLCLIPKKLQKFDSLTLSHCELGSAALNCLFENLQNQNQLKNLDLSWNNLNSEAIEIVCNMLQHNNSLEKLLIQHNYVETSGAQHIVHAIKNHTKIKYLDISANEIHSQGFMYFTELFQMNHGLKYLFMRKNEIDGSEVSQFPQKLVNNTNLLVLDLQGNAIENDCAEKIIQLLNINYNIEDILITGNLQISQNTKETIIEECRKNILIKQYIVPNLQLQEEQDKQEEILKVDVSSHFKNMNVEMLRLEDQNFQRSDFIAKFINMNKNQFHQLSLCRVFFDENLKDLSLYFRNSALKLTRLEINDCSISESTCKLMMESFKQMTTLKELRLISLDINQVHTKELVQSISDIKTLRILDLSHNHIQSMEDISNLLSKNQYIQELNLEGNPIGKIEDFRYLLVGMANNVSVVKFSFELKRILLDEQIHESDKIDKKEITLLEQQVEMNRYINKEIIPIHVQKRIKNTNTVDMSYHDIDETNIDAVIKFFKIQLLGQVKKTKLIMVSCNIDDSTILALVGALLKIGNFELELLDLSYNNFSDEGCAHLTNLFQTGKRIKSLGLGKNYLITAQGFKTIMKSIRKNSIISSLDFSQCSIDISGNQGFDSVLEDIQQNCSLINLDLSGNNIKEELIEQLNSELQQNKSIQDIIIPSILKKGQQQQIQKKLNIKPSLFENLRAGGTLNFGSKKHRAESKKGSEENYTDNHLNSVPRPFEKENLGLQERADSKSSFQDGQSNSISSKKGEYADLDQNAQIQKLSLRGKNLKSLDFLSKFMRLNPNILDIDLGENPLTDKEMQKFTKNVQNNPNIRKIDLDGIKNLKSGTRTIINNEITKNDLIQDFIKNNLNVADGDKTQLNLQHKSIHNIGFLYKFLQGYKDLKILDLRDNQLGKRGAIEITNLIKETKTIEVLNLQSNRIGPTGLQHICSALIENSSIKVLDIRDNLIEDESLKILLVMLFNNNTIEQIQYSLTSEENIRKRDLFKSISHLEIKDIEQKLKDEDHGDHGITSAQKICFPIWCWKSFIHDKHEAFRFKYDTKSLRKIEDEVMDEMTLILQINSFIYYFIIFVSPVIFVEECGNGLSDTSHYIYIFYSLCTIIMEVFLVLKIQKRVQNENILKFNKWHVVEVVMGQIARFDTYLDVCFFSLLFQCSQWELVIPVGIFIVLYLIYPFYTLIRVSAMNHSLKHTMPKIERNCMVSFIREQMLLATVLDSFCIDNSIEVFKKPVHFGRFMGVYTLLFQDGPQMLIHLIFLFFLDSHISHTETTVILSLIVSTFAIHISVFNIVMCTQNEFDPILLQLELKKRKDKLDLKENKIKHSKEMINKKLQVHKQLTGSQQKENRFQKQESHSDFQDDVLRDSVKRSNIPHNKNGYDQKKEIQKKLSLKAHFEVKDNEKSPKNKKQSSDADFSDKQDYIHTESMSPALKSKEMKEMQHQREKHQQNAKNNQTPKFQMMDNQEHANKRGVYLEINRLQKQKSYDLEATGFTQQTNANGGSYNQGHSGSINNPQSMDFTRQPFENSNTDR